MALAVILSLANAGCTMRTFQVDAIKSAEVAASGDAFVVVNANPELDDDDPLVREAAEYVKTAMSAKGKFEAPDNIPANMTVEVDFGKEAPKKEIVQHEVPVYRRVREPGHYVTETYVDSKGNTRTIERYVPGPEYEELVGWREQNYVIVVYPKYLRITAREAPVEGDDRPPRELWSVYVTNEDDEENIEESLPMLVAAAMDAIDQNASTERTVTMSETDERVVFIKRGM